MMPKTVPKKSAQVNNWELRDTFRSERSYKDLMLLVQNKG